MPSKKIEDKQIKEWSLEDFKKRMASENCDFQFPSHGLMPRMRRPLSSGSMIRLMTKKLYFPARHRLFQRIQLLSNKPRL